MDIEQQIKALKDSLREVMQIITQRGEPLSGELKLKVAQAMEHVANRIQQLRQEQGAQEQNLPESPITAPVPEMRSSMDSSNIEGFNYDYDNQKLLVKFHGDGIYSYDGVQPFIFNTFRKGAVAAKTTGQNQYGRWWKGKVPSLGAAFYALIRNGGYSYNKVA
jgi:KTSC domain